MLTMLKLNLPPPCHISTNLYLRGLKLSRHSGPQLKQIAVRRAALIFVRKNSVMAVINYFLLNYVIKLL